MFTRLRRAVIAGAAASVLLGGVPGPAFANPTDEPLARFEEAICPGVAGLKVDAAEYVVGQIRAGLEAFGRRLAPVSACTPNLIVAVVPSGQAFVQAMDREAEWTFSDLSPTERAELLADTSPARAVVRVVPRNRDGQPIERQLNLVDVPQTTGFMAHSKIYTSTRNDIVNVLVLVDRSAMRGVSLEQLAAYATFRALTRDLPQTPEARSQSIVSLFDGGERPAGLTEFDRAFLGELYSGIPNLPGTSRQLALEQATGVDIFTQ